MLSSCNISISTSSSSNSSSTAVINSNKILMDIKKSISLYAVTALSVTMFTCCKLNKVLKMLLSCLSYDF